MYEAYEYTKRNGILLREDYSSYMAGQGTCTVEKGNYHFKNLGMLENDGMSNE